MRKTILVILILIPVLAFGQKEIEFTSDEMLRFEIGMKISNADRELQQIASGQGISTNMEDHLCINTDDSRQLIDLGLDSTQMRIYKYGEDKVFLFYKDFLSIIILESIAYNNKIDARNDIKKLQTKLSQTWGKRHSTIRDKHFWVSDKFIILLSIDAKNYDAQTYVIKLSIAPKEWLPKEIRDKMEEKINEEYSEPEDE